MLIPFFSLIPKYFKSNLQTALKICSNKQKKMSSTFKALLSLWINLALQIRNLTLIHILLYILKNMDSPHPKISLAF